MKTLILFEKSRCLEFSPQATPADMPAGYEVFKRFVPEEPIENQIPLTVNDPYELSDGLSIMSVDADSHSFSILGKLFVQISSLPASDIVLGGKGAELFLTDGYLEVFDDSDVYLDGKKIGCGKFPLSVGSCIWAGSTRIIMRGGYITCTGTHYLSNLNISAQIYDEYEEFPDYKRSPRIIKREPTENMELAMPKEKEEPKKGELVKIVVPPLVMSLVTVGMGMMLGRGLFMLISAAAMLVSVVFSITTFISDSKTRREKEKERQEQYENYLLAQRKKIHALYTEQRESMLYHNLSPKEIENEILSYSSRLYERAANDSDFLTLSLGYTTLPASYKIKYNSDNGEVSKDPLASEARALGAEYQNITDLPAVIDLKQAHLGLVGEKYYIHRQLNSILCQLCFFQSYLDIELIILTEESDRHLFEWTRWYPHCQIKSINVTGLVTAENQRDQVLGNIAQVLKTRRQKQDEGKKESRYLPHYIFIIDNPKLIINHSIMEYLQTPETTQGFSIITATNIRSNLPDNIRTVFMLDGGDRGTLLINEGVLLNRSVILYNLEGIDLETCARRLAPLRHKQGISTQIPESVTFFELYGVKRPEEIPVLSLWNRNNSFKSLSVPLGLRGKDDLVHLNLHERAHGPHGLVAGTTGSGKSEILQSYILSLAVNFHPHEIGFLLIDYKGGGMANLFLDLPHLLGTITNLDGNESMRALASIKSELARRQRILNNCGVNNINQYTKLFKNGEADLPMPHLYIISDEFAELKKEQPDFMSELVSAARIGRSLGVHLILATQKPSGVVDDQIWSNSRFKLALKVATDSDSNEIIKTPDASRITQPGRAYLQVGNNEIFELFQSAWSGAPYSEEVTGRGFDNRVYLINQLGQGELLNEDLSAVDVLQDTNISQLDVTVKFVKEVYEGTQSILVEKPWLPPLPVKLVTSYLKLGTDVGRIDAFHLVFAIGLADIPEEQRQTEFTHNFLNDGNLAVFGASGFGKSTVAMNAALSLASTNSPELLNYFLLDYGNSALTQLRDLPHTADYLGIDDTDKLNKLVKLLSDELKRRKSLFASVNAVNFKMYNEVVTERIAAIIVFIDNYDVIRETNADLEEFLVRLTRDGIGVGIYTVITASRGNAVRYSVLNNFKNKIALFMFDNSDITSIVGRCAYTLPEIRGRAMVKLKDTHVAQCYLPVEYEDDISYSKLIGQAVADIVANNSARKATGVRVVQDKITYEDLIPHIKINERMVVIGFDTETTNPSYLDLNIAFQMIVGGPSTGKTNILKIIQKQFIGMPYFVSDSRAGDLHELENAEEAVYMGANSQFENFYLMLSAEVEKRSQAFQASGLKPREYCMTQPPLPVLIDDGDNFIELCKSRARDMEALVPKAAELGISFIITTLPTRMKGFDNLTKTLKDTQGGLVLGHPGEQIILQAEAPRGYKAVADIGFWYKRGDTRQVKIPLV